VMQGQARRKNPNRRTKKSTATDQQYKAPVCNDSVLCISDKQHKTFQARDLFHQTITAAGNF
jgi:hypothetical protein